MGPKMAVFVKNGGGNPYTSVYVRVRSVTSDETIDFSRQGGGTEPSDAKVEVRA